MTMRSAEHLNDIAGLVLILLMGLALLAGPSNAVDHPVGDDRALESPVADPVFRHNGE